MNAPLAKEQIALLMSDSLTYRTPVVEGTDGTISDAAPRGLMQGLGSVVTALLAPMRRRSVLNELSSLTDRELADIGLNRSELDRVFDQRFAESRRRSTVAAELHQTASA